MERTWFLIDDDGCRRIDVSEKKWDFWSEFRAGDADDAWPAFTQAAVRTDLARAQQAIHQLAAEFGLSCRDVTHLPEQWDEALCLADGEALTLMAEPQVDFDDRFMAPDTAEQLLANLESDGAFFGYDPSAGTLMLTIFEGGRPRFSWCDSLEPGPSHAVTFHDDGTATEEDPRRFALRRMGQPETSPFLDRYAFVEHELARLGLVDVAPNLGDRPIVAALQLEAEPNVGLG